MFRYAHLADIHIGGWRDPKMKDLSTKAFGMAVDKIIEEKLDFVLISGDVFNTALPQIDKVKEVTKKLYELKEKGIPVYLIAGSHDFSPSGKTMLDVLEHAGLWKNVVCGEVVDNQLKLAFTIDSKTGAKITGLLGKKGMLDRIYYENLIRENLESESGYKIFMFHTALSEFKPKEFEHVEAHPLSFLPKKFNYYAGGHVHYIFSKLEPEYGLITYPGPIYPNNFAELEKLGNGGFYIVTASEAVKSEMIKEASANSDNSIDSEYSTSIKYISLKLNPLVSIVVESKHNTPAMLTSTILSEIEKHDAKDAIVAIRVEGTINGGHAQSIDFNQIFDELYKKGAYFVMKNTNQLVADEFEEIKINDEVVEEDKIISEHVGKSHLFSAEQEKKFVLELLHALSVDKQEGERASDFDDRIISEVKPYLPIF